MEISNFNWNIVVDMDINWIKTTDLQHTHNFTTQMSLLFLSIQLNMCVCVWRIHRHAHTYIVRVKYAEDALQRNKLNWENIVYIYDNIFIYLACFLFLFFKQNESIFVVEYFLKSVSILLE